MGNSTAAIEAEFVRCKDCKHTRVLKDGRMACNVRSGEYDIIVQPSGFCSSGEQRVTMEKSKAITELAALLKELSDGYYMHLYEGGENLPNIELELNALDYAIRCLRDPESDKTGKWISVEDRLPEITPTVNNDGSESTVEFSSEYCLVITKERGCEVARYLVDLELGKDEDENYTFSAWIGNEYADVISNVTHWMPLPEPPKMER